MPSKVEELAVHFIMTCDDKSYMAAARSVPYEKGLRAAVTFLKVRRGNIVTCAQKIARFRRRY